MRLFYLFLLLAFSFSGAAQTIQEQYKIAQQLFQAQRYSEAQHKFNQLLKLEPQHLASNFHLLQIAFKLKDFKLGTRALKILSQQKKKPISAEIFTSLAQIVYTKTTLNEGIVFLNQYLTQFPNNAKIALLLAKFYKKGNDTPKQILSLKFAKKQAPKDPEVSYQLALHYEKKEARKSMELYTSLLTHPQYKEVALVALGQLYQRHYQKTKQLRSLEKAQSYFERYAKLHPNNIDTRQIIQSINRIINS